MKTLTVRLRHICAVAVLTVAVAACGETAPSRFFTLSSMPPPASVPRSTDPLAIGVGPVTLAAYLDRPQIVTREGSYQVTLSEFERWAEPLQDMVPRVLIENLSTLLRTNDVIQMPSRRVATLDYQVEVGVIQFDANEAGGVVLDARWELFGADGRRSIARYRSTITEQAEAPTPDGVAAAMSRALAALSGEIAEAIQAAPR